MQLHGRHALEVRHDQKHRQQPVLVADLRAFHDRARPHAEALAAASLLAAAERHGLVLASELDVPRPAIRAAHPGRPAMPDEPLLGLLVARKAAQDGL